MCHGFSSATFLTPHHHPVELTSWTSTDAQTDRQAWLQAQRRSFALKLRLVEDELTNLVTNAQEMRRESVVFIPTREFKQEILRQALPILRRRQRIAEDFNNVADICFTLPDEIFRVIFDYATCSIQDGFTFPGRRNLYVTLQLASSQLRLASAPSTSKRRTSSIPPIMNTCWLFPFPMPP